MSAMPGTPIGEYEGAPLYDVTGLAVALVERGSGGRMVAYKGESDAFEIEFIPDLPPVVHKPDPARALFELHGYAARQWRKRLVEGEETKVAFSVLPRDAQLEVRALDRLFRRQHSRLTALRAPGGSVTIAAYFD